MNATESPVRVLFSCTGIGLENRGIESFFREAFDGLKNTPGIDARLIRSKAGCRKEPAGDREYPVWCLPRYGKVAPLISKLTGRSSYAAEQWSSFPGVVREIRHFKPHVVYTSEANLCFLLRRFRKQIGVPFRVLFSNGGPCHPPFDRYDFVQQVAPLYREQALAAGEPAEKHLFVPYGIRVPDTPLPTTSQKIEIRQRLGLPVDRQIVLSVGWIAKKHKRMHYLIEEVARMSEPRPFVQILGAMDENSTEILTMARQLLGDDGFSAKSVPYNEVADYYHAADAFVLCSLAEGFGRVYLEAMMHGLPTIGHRHPVIEYVLGESGIVEDLNVQNTLAGLLPLVLADSNDHMVALQRRREIHTRFAWESLSKDYRIMFQAATVAQDQTHIDE
jgi:glycosyltransferase involved in cell wall biosynthesis